MKENIIAQGAEAKIILKENFIIKNRIAKAYRHPELDKKIIKQRTKAESKLLSKASKIILVPIPEKSKEPNVIKMPFIKGQKLSENLNKFSLKKQYEIMKIIGDSIAKLHKLDIIHGDLTTSNMIFIESSKELFFIDFGLGYISRKIEDKAVDLHLLKQALEAKHFKNWNNLIKKVFHSYEKTIGKHEAKKVFDRITSIEKRGRYRN